MNGAGRDATPPLDLYLFEKPRAARAVVAAVLGRARRAVFFRCRSDRAAAPPSPRLVAVDMHAGTDIPRVVDGYMHPFGHACSPYVPGDVTVVVHCGHLVPDIRDVCAELLRRGHPVVVTAHPCRYVDGARVPNTRTAGLVGMAATHVLPDQNDDDDPAGGARERRALRHGPPGHRAAAAAGAGD